MRHTRLCEARHFRVPCGAGVDRIRPFAHHGWATRPNDPRSITAEGLARLLARLHADAGQAGQEYERLRRALVKFFDWRGALAPDECADETIDRLARKLDETTVDDVRHYAHGIARMVLLERRRQPLFESFDEDPAVASAPVTQASDEHERLHDCLELCLAEHP